MTDAGVFPGLRAQRQFQETGIRSRGWAERLSFSPLDDASTTQMTCEAANHPGRCTGIGVAYELSPSWESEPSTCGLLMKTPNFGLEPQKTGAS